MQGASSYIHPFICLASIPTLWNVLQPTDTNRVDFKFQLRKLRCDPTPKGCWQCTSASHPCQVTDRVTGETFLRGEASQLKAENEDLKARVSELEGTVQQLRSENEGLHAQVFYRDLMQVWIIVRRDWGHHHLLIRNLCSGSRGFQVYCSCREPP